MPCIKSCEACIHRGLFCNGDTLGCDSCLRGGFICTAEDYRDCPVVSQPAWVEQQATAAEVTRFQTEDIITTHFALITSLTTFYDTLISMHYLRENEVIRPPQVAQQIDLPALVQSRFEAETIALILHLPQINIRRTGDAEIDILPDGFLPFPYLNLSNLQTISHDNHARDPFYHNEDDERDWSIPPWTCFITRPDSQRGYGFHHCRIYDMRSKTLGLWSLGLWSYAMLPGVREGQSDMNNDGRVLIDARPAEEVIGEWIARLHSLEWLPSLTSADRKIETARTGENFNDALARARDMQDEWKIGSIRRQRQDYNKYWAQRAIYAACGWPGQLQSEELGRRKSEWTAAVQRLHSRLWQEGGEEELEEYYRSLAGDRAL
ncbi:hypothetical protein BDW67DRAFT_194452 [Aspergillus spinulosporus]